MIVGVIVVIVSVVVIVVAVWLKVLARKRAVGGGARSERVEKPGVRHHVKHLSMIGVKIQLNSR